MKPKLLIVTGNAMKFKELSIKLERFFDCEQKDWDEAEIQGTPEEIIQHKAAEAYEKFKQPVLVDDTSLHFEALNGFPGPYVKAFWECFSPYETGVKFAGTGVTAICWLGLCRAPGDIIVVKGAIEGKVVTPKTEDHQGRQFDLFFQADDTDKPMLGFSHEEKMEFSHRGKALDNLLEILKKESK